MMKSLTEVEGYTPVEYVFTESFKLQFCIDLDVVLLETRCGCWAVNRNTDNTLHRAGNDRDRKDYGNIKGY